MVSRTGLIVRAHDDQHYVCIFNPESGFFARVEQPGHPEPFWSAHGPELIDLAITNWCDRNCSFCYRSSHRNGKHMDIGHYEALMEQARDMSVLQVALGGGNPNQHPRFVEILRLTRQDYGIVPNYTTNGRGLSERVLRASRSWCGAVAVSAYPPYEEMAGAIKKLVSYGIRTNVHFLLDATSIHCAMRWLEEPPEFLQGLNALIFLNYKPVGRQVFRDRLLRNSVRLESFFRLATSRRAPFKIGFDACSATGLCRYTAVPKICYEGCDSGRFSMFISEDFLAYPCSFMADAGYTGIPILHTGLLGAWQDSGLFRRFRAQVSGGDQSSCGKARDCPIGCPVYREIDLCGLHGA